MTKILIISFCVFIVLLYLNYIGAKGRIERSNQFTGLQENLGPVSEKEEMNFIEGKHKKTAFFQAFVGSLIWSLIVFSLLYFIFI